MREWLPFSGRDAEGDKYDDVCLVDSSTGQILAAVQLPKSAEYWFGVEVYIPYSETLQINLRFIDLEPAKKFCEGAVETALEEWECQKVATADWRREAKAMHARKARRKKKEALCAN